MSATLSQPQKVPLEVMKFFIMIVSSKWIYLRKIRNLSKACLMISFWNEWGNDGIIRTEEGPSEDVADFYNELSENWYYFALPTV